MRPRVLLGRLLIRLGRLIQSLALMVMRPDDLIAFGNASYSKPDQIEGWGAEMIVDQGLDPDEADLFHKISSRKGKLLLLGLGGGREAIVFAGRGFEVTGIDFVPQMVETAMKNAERHGVTIRGAVQEISSFKAPKAVYDIIWLSSGMYSSVPGRKRRVEMLKSIGAALKPDGRLVCQFRWHTAADFSPKVEFFRKTVAWLTLGNLAYETGDRLWVNKEFIHEFSSEEALYAEFKAGGFRVTYRRISPETRWGGAILEPVCHE